VVDPLKIFLTPSVITMQNLVNVSHAVCAHVGGPKNVRDDGAHSLRMGGVADPLKHAPPPRVTIPIFFTLGQTMWAYTLLPHVKPYQICSL